MTPNEAQAILDNIDLYGIRFRALEHPVSDLDVLIMWDRPDACHPENPGKLPIVCRLAVSHFATEIGLLSIVWRALKMMMIHEAAEFFRYKGQRIYDPHLPENTPYLSIEHAEDTPRLEEWMEHVRSQP